jgi:hypothetical protein
MNYYEELGIRPDADEEEIRKAHRRLVKIMHPDQHRDQQMKQLAETQMRRLNSVVATLLDPEERQEYDEQLRGVNDAHGAGQQQSIWRSVPWWIASTLGAIILTVAAVWFFADHYNAGFRASPNPPEITAEPKKTDEPSVVRVPMHQEATPAPTPPPPSGGAPATAEVEPRPLGTPPPVKVSEPPKPVEVPKKETIAKSPVPVPMVTPKPVDHPKDLPASVKVPSAIATSRDHVAATRTPPPQPAYRPPTIIEPKKVAQLPKVDNAKKFQPGKLVTTAPTPMTKSTLDARLAPPPGPVATPDAGPTFDTGTTFKPPPPIHRSNDPLEGEWVYAPTEPEKPKAGLYPPEFIQLRLQKGQDGMRGEYSARYNVVDKRSISPNVNFVLKSVDNSALKYTWTAADGSHGTFVISKIESDTMRLEWKQTSSRNGPTLTSGVATLVRKN